MISAFLGCASLVAQPQQNVERKPVSVDTSSPGALNIRNNSGREITFTVYSITGQVVRTVELKGDSIAVALPQGFYVLKCDYGTMKVVVK